MAKNDLIFKYNNGTRDVPEFAKASAGTIYIKKKSDTRAEMFIHTPLENDTDTGLKLQVGGSGNVYVGDPKDPEAQEYQAVINPNGSVIENFVTSEQAGGFVIRVVSPSNPDTYVPQDNPNSNMITLVI